MGRNSNTSKHWLIYRLNPDSAAKPLSGEKQIACVSMAPMVHVVVGKVQERLNFADTPSKKMIRLDIVFTQIMQESFFLGHPVVRLSTGTEPTLQVAHSAVAGRLPVSHQLN